MFVFLFILSHSGGFIYFKFNETPEAHFSEMECLMYQAVIIDDEPLIVESIAKAIDWSGFQIEIALASSDPAAALDYILNHPVQLIITDVSMPGLSGLQLIQKAKAMKPNLYVVVLSAYDNFEYVRTALRCGAENYLLKPLDPDELSDTVSQIVHQLQEREQLSSTYGRSMMTFRSAFTEQWVKNMLSGSDLVTRAELLGINLDAPSFTCVIFSCPEGRAADMSLFFERFLCRLPGHASASFFFETPLRLVCVLSLLPTFSGSAADFVKPVITMSRVNNLPIFASIGADVSDCREVPASYRQAESLLFLQNSPIPLVVWQDYPGLSKAAEEALLQFDAEPEPESSAAAALFSSFPPVLCSLQLLSTRILALYRDGQPLSELPSSLSELLASFPVSPDGSSFAADCPDTIRNLTLCFLSESRGLLQNRSISSPMVDAVIKSIHEFSDKDISLKTIAARLNVTPSYLGTMFRQQTGCYFNDYLMDARLGYAAELLETSALRIKDIVDRAGFSSHTYFNRAFKRHYGVSPVSFRREKKMQQFAD